MKTVYSKGLALDGAGDGAGGVTIRAHEGAAAVPVLTVQVLDRAAGLGGGARIAENVVSLLNGNAPAHRIEPADGARLFFQRAASGLILRVKGAAGLSRPAVAILATGGDDGLSARALGAMDNLLMKALCDMAAPLAPQGGAGGGPKPDGPRP